MIRKAGYEDIPKLFALGQRIHAASGDKAIPLDEVRARTQIAGLLASGDGFVLVDEVNGEITGLLAAFCQPMWFSKKRYALPLVAYAERRGAFVWMVKRFVKWAIHQKRVAEIVFDASFGGVLGEKANALLPKLGFEVSGTTFVLRGELSPVAA